MNICPVFLFAFSNDSMQRLQLDKEWRATEKIFQSKNDLNQLVFDLIPSTIKNDIWDKVERFHNRTVVFHYSGHSDEKGLVLQDTNLTGKNLAVLLGKEKNLRLVFLNGCSNVAQVRELFEQGVKAVIATSTPISDDRAIKLSGRFYSALIKGRSLIDAFEVAAAYVNNELDEVFVEYRSRGLTLNKLSKDFPWGLYVSDEAILNWSLKDCSPKVQLPKRKRFNLNFVFTISFGMILMLFVNYFGFDSAFFSGKEIAQHENSIPTLPIDSSLLVEDEIENSVVVPTETEEEGKVVKIIKKPNQEISHPIKKSLEETKPLKTKNISANLGMPGIEVWFESIENSSGEIGHMFSDSIHNRIVFEVYEIYINSDVKMNFITPNQGLKTRYIELNKANIEKFIRSSIDQ